MPIFVDYLTVRGSTRRFPWNPCIGAYGTKASGVEIGICPVLRVWDPGHKGTPRGSKAVQPGALRNRRAHRGPELEQMFHLSASALHNCYIY